MKKLCILVFIGLLTCKYSFIDSSDNSVVEEYVYPEK